MKEGAPVLQAVNVGKAFGQNQVLENIDFEIMPAEIHSLIGENGAGKSTLLKILFGVYKPCSGSVLMDGKEVHLNSPMQAREHGIAMINQEPQAFADMTVFENIVIGNMNKTKMGFFDRKDLEEKAARVLDRLGLNLRLDQKMIGLSVAEQQLVEIGAALMSDAKILFMDEPTASLTPDEVEKLFKIINKLQAKGKSIVYVSHRLDEVKLLSDRITVLKDGNKVGTYDNTDISKEEMIIKMIGCSLNEFVKKERSSRIGNPFLEVDNISIPGIFRNVSFNLHRGEILGVFGLMGSGRTEVARALFGITPIVSGEIRMEKKKISITSPFEAIKNKIALVPEDRQELGVLLEQGIAFNTSFAVPKQIMSRIGWIDRSREEKLTADFVGKLKTKYTHLNQLVGDLSGGNQQKISLAKWLAANPEVLILDEPTRGIDVGAKTEVYKIINRLAAEGKSIIMISSEIEEVIGLSDRIMVMYEGTCTAILEHDEISEKNVLSAAHDHVVESEV